MRINLTIGIPVWLDFIFTCPLLAYRLLRFGYTYRRIYLGEDEWTILDQQDYYRFGNLKWSVSGNGKKFYATRFLKIAPGKTKTLSLHRAIMDAPKGLVVDHINGDGLDNRRANLRLATQSQNCCNKRKRENTSSQFRGVSFCKARGVWIAYINVAGKRILLSYFDSEIEAAKTYDAAARKYHGEFARLNFTELQTQDARLKT